ncbi:GEVED domain-containing protein [Flavobacterium sp. XGLA_31]|uniref:GEVED domain-containing protein n=1 Tax=Flavobacterium sp. XGLA_31 TaxID=3447666 RepID=UPI003F2D8A56
MKKSTFSGCTRMHAFSASGYYLCFLVLSLFLFGQSTYGQTLLINPAAEGGFENGTSFAANGWTAVNANTNTWNVGTVPGWFSGNGGAYVSNDSGATWAFTNSVVNTSSFYRDVTFPAGAGSVVLSFDWRANGNDGNWDNLLVYVMDTAVTPTTAGPVNTATTTTGWTGYTNGTTGYFLLQRNGTTAPTTTTNVSYTLSAAQLAYVSGATKRLVFVWKNDGSGGTNPPAAIDNISLVAYTCQTPTALTASALTSGSATINWTAPASVPANGYEYEVRTSGTAGSGATGLVTSGNTTATSLNVTTLTANTTYTYYVRSKCGVADFSSWTSATFFTGYCIPSSTSNATYINNFSTTNGSTNISNLASGYALNGYQDNYNTASVSQYPTGIINFASDIVGGSVGTCIWVDWNNDLVFDNTTERVFATTSYGYNQTGSFSIPAGTALGNYRMRIRIDYNNSTPDACSNANTRTEAEDYKLTVIAPPACLPPTGLTAAAATAFTATLNWTASITTPSNGYDYYVSPVNTAPTAGTAPTNSVGAGVLTASVNGLNASTTYYVWIRSNCGSGTTSVWTSVPVSFVTPCNPPVITGTTTGSACGEGSLALTATPSAGFIRWYDAATGGTEIGSGNLLMTPVLHTTTSYWAEAAQAGSVQSTGKTAPGTDATGSSTTNYGIVFNAATPIDLQSISVFSTTAGTINIKVTNSALTELYATGNVAVAAGGSTTPNVIPLNFSLPAGTGYRILIKASSGISLLRDSTVAFPYNGTDGNVAVTASEWGGTTTSYYYYFYDLKYKSVCVSPRTEVVATVTTPPAFALSTTATTPICNGQTTAPVTIATGSADYDTFVWSSNNGLSGNEVTGWSFNPSETIQYTLTAQASGADCITHATVTVAVNANPTVAVSASNNTICSGGSATLTATSQILVPGTVTIGTGTTLTSATTQPTAFCNRWAQYWNQTIFTAAELTAAGLKPGKITSITYNITTLGSGTNVTAFRVSIGTTTNTTLTAFETAGLTQVYGPATYTHAVGANTITFDTPYVWDGVSNIVLDIRQNGVDSTNNAITYYTATTGNTTISAVTSTAMTTSSVQNLVTVGTVTPTTSTQRLNVVFGGQVAETNTASFTWTPATFSGNPIVVSPASAATYTVRGTNNATGCYSEATVNVGVTSTPAPTGDAIQTFAVFNAAEATVANLVATGTNVVWYASSSDALAGVNALAPTTELVNGAVYYAMQTVDGCRSISPLEVTVTVTLGTDNFDLSGLKYYPNPVNNVLNIEFAGGITTVEVYNTIGQKITSQNVNAMTTTIDMSKLANGTYFVKVASEHAAKTIQVIKN